MVTLILNWKPKNVVRLMRNNSVKERIFVIPDVHVPNHNKKAFGACLEYLKDYRPTTFISVGDWCDWDSVTSYDPKREDDVVCIEDEVNEACKVLRELEKCLPKNCNKFMIGGNHEERMTKWKVKHGHLIEMRRLRKILNWWEYYKLEEHGWKWNQYGEVYEHGHILFTHGWYTGGQHAKRHLGLYHKCIIYGHTHEFQVAVENGFDGHPIMSASIGTLSNFNLSYLVGKPPVNWINMFATIDVMSDGTFTPSFIPIINGKFIKDGKQYGV